MKQFQYDMLEDLTSSLIDEGWSDVEIESYLSYLRNASKDPVFE